MSRTQIETRADGLYTVRDIFGHVLERKVGHDWHVLFVDSQGMKRLGYVVSVNALLQTITILDDVVYPHAPSPMSAMQETVGFSQVLEAGSGFSRPRREVFTEKKHGVREVWVIDESNSIVGFVVTKGGLRLYAEKINDRWEVR